MYDVIELAWWVIREFDEAGKHLTHLELQAILCHLQKISIKKYNQKLFQDKIKKGVIGEYIEKIYFNFSIYAGIDIFPTKYDPDIVVVLKDDLVDEMYNKLKELRWYEQTIDKESKNYLD